jgi:hypothetical protein
VRTIRIGGRDEKEAVRTQIKSALWILVLVLMPIVSCQSHSKPKIVDKQGNKWPECVPPDPKDPFGEFNNNLSVNGTPYKCSAEGRWIVDQAGVDTLRKIDEQQRQFIHNLSTRKMTHAELMNLTPGSNIFMNQTYYAAEKYADLYEVLVHQWELQTGKKMPFYTPLSKARGEYGRSPQEYDNRRAVESLIQDLQLESSIQVIQDLTLRLAKSK